MGASIEEVEAVYRRSLDSFLRVAAAMLGGRDAAREAVQEGFAVAVAKRGQYRGSGTVEAWIWAVVLNTVRTHRRLRHPGPYITEIEEPDVAERFDGVHAAVAALPARQREVVFLRYYADLDYDDIAAALGIRPGTVGATLSAARETLRNALREEVA